MLKSTGEFSLSVSLFVRSLSDTRKYASTDLKLMHIVHVSYSMFHIESEDSDSWFTYRSIQMYFNALHSMG